jgi:hypothetical protein
MKKGKMKNEKKKKKRKVFFWFFFFSLFFSTRWNLSNEHKGDEGDERMHRTVPITLKCAVI